MLQQYRELKARFPDAILLFRLGDFYEMFEEDARIGARELELVLTSRRFSKAVRLPMCGVPYRTVTTYIGRLIGKGYKVALVEQLEDARKVKRLVKRDVVRVITPGTVVEEALLQDKAPNFLVAVVADEEQRAFGLAAVELSTGEFAVTQVDGDNALNRLEEELQRLRPREYVLPRSLADDEAFTGRLRAANDASVRISSLDDSDFAPDVARDRLLTHFGLASLESFGCEGLPLAVAAAGGALHYLKQSQISDLAHLNRLWTYSLTDYMTLDAVTRRNLELTETLRERSSRGSLFDMLDHTRTAMGARLLRRWLHRPLLDLIRIREREDAVEEMVTTPFLRTDLRELLSGIYDVERLVGRIGFGNANARDLVALKRVLTRVPRIKACLNQARTARLQALQQALDECADVAQLIEQAIVDTPPILVKGGGLIRVGYHSELDRLREQAAAGRDWLAELEARERERTGIKTLRIRYNEVFGFFLEVPRSQSDRVPPEYERRATITHAERFTSPELKAKEAEILAAEDRIKELEYDLFAQVRRDVAAHSARLQATARILAELDALASLAEVAARNNYVKPMVDESDIIEIREGRHPVVEHMLPEGERFVPNDTLLNGSDHRLLIITGPNMAGKSVLVRQVALIVLLAQLGSFVPAASARIGLVDRIFTRVGATDDIAAGRSSFLVEMSETSAILQHATPRSLVILDEVGRGTSTYDGMSIAWAVAEELHNVVGARTLFATHYHELTQLAQQLPGVRNYNLAVVERGHEIVFLRRLVPGGADKSYGIQVARLAGLPERVVCRALELLATLEQQRRGPAQESAPTDQAGEGITVVREEPVAWEATPAPSTPSVVRLQTSAGEVEIPFSPDLLWELLQELYRLDIANMTPVEALVKLNDIQGRLREAAERADRP